MFRKKVGRPSKKTVRRRKIIKSIKVFSILGIILFLIFKICGIDGINKLKGSINTNGVTRTATFVSTGTDYIETTSISCQDFGEGCYIRLPRFNKTGHFSSWWSTKPLPSEDLTGQKRDGSYFFQIGSKYKLTKNKTFYPNFNHYYYDHQEDEQAYKYRNLSIKRSIGIGETFFEFETGIPDEAIDNFIDFAKSAQKEVPWEFTPTKVFIMTPETYSSYSKYTGVTHSLSNVNAYLIVDMQYEKDKNKIREEILIHELAHTWDRHYQEVSGKTLHEQEDITNLYTQMLNRKIISDRKSSEGKYRYLNYSNGFANVEWFADMIDNYYFHILHDNDNYDYFCLSKDWTKEEKETWKRLVEKYIGLSGEWAVEMKNEYSNKGITLMDENITNVANKTVNKNLCIENEIYYFEINKEDLRFSLDNNNLKVKKGNSTNLLYKPAKTSLKKGSKTTLTIIDKNNKRRNTKVTFVNNTDCTIYNIANSKVDKIPDQSSTKDVIKPEPVIKVGNKVLEKNKDYSLSYSNDVEKGIGKVTISGKGNYYGKKIVSYKIVKVTDDIRNTVGAAKIQINIPQVLKDGTCTKDAQIVSFKDLSGKGISEIQYKTDRVTNWTKLGDGKNKSKIRISIKKSHEKMWFRVIDSYNNTKEFGSYTANIKNDCSVNQPKLNNQQNNNTQPKTNNNSQQQQNNNNQNSNAQPKTNNQQNSNVQPKTNNNSSEYSVTQINTLKVNGIDTKGCKNRGVTFTIDSTGDNGASIKKIEISTDGKTWKTSNSCSGINSKKATCKINNKYSALYYKVTTSHNHYQILGRYCTN